MTKPSAALANPPDAGEVARQLNEHGYAFQQAVLRRVHELEEESRTIRPWVFEAAELPVAVGDHETRIDFILRHSQRSRFLVGECKRANPAYSDWCFFQTLYVRRNSTSDRLLVDRWHHFPDGASSWGAQLSSTLTTYGVALAVNSQRKGNAGGWTKNSIEEASTQVMWHAAGLINHLGGRPQLVGADDALIFPVIFTTAHLWISDVALESTDVESGNVDSAELNLRAPANGWVAYQYHRSVSARPAQASVPGGPPDTLGNLLDQAFERTIFIASPEGIGPLLGFLAEVGS